MKRLIPLLVLSMAMVGCQMKIEQSITVREDGSGRLSVFSALDEELEALAESSGEDWMEVLRSEFPEDPELRTSIEEASEGGFSGVRSGRDCASFERCGDLIEGFNRGMEILAGEYDLSRDGNAFRFGAEIAPGEIEELEALGGLDPSSYLLLPLRLELPGRITDHNADEVVEDGTLVWNLKAGENASLFATSELSTGLAYGPWLALSVAFAVGLVLLLLIAILVIRKNRPVEVPPIPEVE